MEEWLAEDRSAIRATAAGIESTVTRIETGLVKMRDNISRESRLADRTLEDIRTRMAGLRFGWREVLAPWIVVVFILGMAFESRTHFLYQWLWAS